MASLTAAGNRIDTLEAQLLAISGQLQTLITAAGGGASGGVGGGGGGGGGNIPATPQRRRLDTSSVEKLHGDVTIPLLRSWRNRWNDFAELSQLATYPGSEQMAAFRMALDPAMQQVVEVALGILPTTVTTPDLVLNSIADYIRAKRNIALDRVAFEERRQGPSETFDDFYIALRRLAEAADLCATCFDTRLVTRIIAGTRDAETKKKLLAMSPFPALQPTINICRSEESARANERSLSGHSGISSIQTKRNRTERPHANECKSCGHAAHPTGTTCPAIGRTCHSCGKPDHFAPKCPTRDRGKSGGGGSNDSSGGSNGGSSGGGGGGSGGSKSKVGHITIGNVQANHRQRRSPTIALEVLLDGSGSSVATINEAIPDPGAEVSVAGRDVMAALGMTEADLLHSPFELVMADRSTSLLSIGQQEISVRYGGRCTRMTVVFFPEIRGMLICHLDCVNLAIIHADYPQPLTPIQSVQIPPTEDAVQPNRPSEWEFLRNIPLPLDPSAEDIAEIEAAIAAEFDSVFDQEDGLRVMVGPDMIIQLRDDAVPYYVNGARPIPFSDRPAVKSKLDNLVSQGVIVPVTEASEWAAPLVVIRNAKTGKIRICVDHTRLNKFVLRPTHPTRTPRDAVAEIDSECRFYTSFDAANGYYQIPLHPSCQHLTTFMTPWGRYKFLRASMGLS